MAARSSDRPITSTTTDSSDAAVEDAKEGASSLIGLSPYVPNILDLVYPASRIDPPHEIDIPPAFLRAEATDSALLLGHGASFTATRQVLPRGHAEVETVDWGGLTVTYSEPAPQRPQYVAYKAARVSFEQDGSPASARDRRALESVLTEFHALLHPELRGHANIINLLGLAWGNSHTDPDNLLPVLVVEYGDLGTLADVQRRSQLTDKVKTNIFCGICEGMSLLHRYNIVHGDVKPDNIIMCSGPRGQMIPKLADFGFAIIDSSATLEIQIRGSKAWRAPETYAPIAAPYLQQTDVYSVGLVAWSMAIGGATPFDLLVDRAQGEADYDAEVLHLKVTDELLHASQFERWIPLLIKRIESLESGSKDLVGEMSSSPHFQQLMTLIRAVPNWHVHAGPLFVQHFRQRPFWKVLEPIFKKSLAKNPSTRSLPDITSAIKHQTLSGNYIPSNNNQSATEIEAAAQTLASLHVSESQQASYGSKASPDDTPESNSVANTSTSTNAEERRRLDVNTVERKRHDWRDIGFQRQKYSWQVMRHLEPGVQRTIARAVIANDKAVMKLLAATFYINGYGVAVDTDKGLECLRIAAQQKINVAQAWLHRCCEALQESIQADTPIINYLSEQALLGSRIALQDLRQLDTLRAEHIHRLLRFGYGGVGAWWYIDSQWLHGLQLGTFLDGMSTPAILGSPSEVRSIVVNLRGDTLLHASAAIGSMPWVNNLLQDPDLNINQLNPAGETALICACRSGNADIVKILLDAGADASIQATNGESPLHWLLSFEPKVNIGLVARDLVERGKAKIDAKTISRAAHSKYPGSADVEQLLPGTPLQWAVRANAMHMVSVLLSFGADPEQKNSNIEMSAVELAAYLHYDQCLRILLEHLERQTVPSSDSNDNSGSPRVVVYGPFIRKAIDASDRWSMILRNGPAYIERLDATLRLLKEKTKLVSHFRMGKVNETWLHLAAAEGHEEACAALLRLNWFSDTINKPAGPTARTPLLESVRWNRRTLYDLLVQHGADACALAPSPFEGRTPRWNALHFFADQGYGDADGDLAFVDDLLAAGVPVDGDPALDIETPCHVAIRRRAFRLADHLLVRGASLDASSRQSAFLWSEHPLTVLGHIIALNAHNSLESVRFVLSPQRTSPAGFIVDQSRSWSALHWCAAFPADLTYVRSEERIPRNNCDWHTNRFILEELLETFHEMDHLDLRSSDGRTALHVAAEYAHTVAIELLVKAGADRELRCDRGETPLDVAERLHAGERMQHIKVLLADENREGTE